MYVLDAVSNLNLGRWDLPGKTGRTPYVSVVSAYRNITYPDDANPDPIIPFGSYPQSWKATPDNGRRNIVDKMGTPEKRVSYVATPGAPHVPDYFIRSQQPVPVLSNRVVINEVRNHPASNGTDWVELKNVSRATVQLENWELSVVTGVGEDTDLVTLPSYTMASQEILLLLPEDPEFTDLIGGINIAYPDEQGRGAIHKYFVAPDLSLPNTGKFVLLLRSRSDKNGEDVAIEDYAGNGFFADQPYTEFWPRTWQPEPTDVADFGNLGSFSSFDSAWARVQYNANTGHHKDAWKQVGTQGGIGYDLRANGSLPGTPGYENTALKTEARDSTRPTPPTDSEYNDGTLTFSEIMVDPGTRHNKTQWIELYNSSFTQAVNLEGWVLEIANLENESVPYVNGSFIFNEAVVLPNQLLLLVSKPGPNNVAANRVYNLYRQHRRDLELSNLQTSLLNPEGFYLRLIDTRNTTRRADDVVVDEAGNLRLERHELIKVWDLPPLDPEVRLSLMRQYRMQGGRSVPAIGTLQDAWQQRGKAWFSPTHYGDARDRGTPGYRDGSPVPVVLSSFYPKRTETGTVRVTWSTASELNNAGFNILRSEQQDAGFTVINPTLISGAGTSAEKHTYSFTDSTAAPDVAYYYQIEDVSFEGVRRTLATVRLKGQIAAHGKLTTTWGHLKTRN